MEALVVFQYPLKLEDPVETLFSPAVEYSDNPLSDEDKLIDEIIVEDSRLETSDDDCPEGSKVDSLDDDSTVE